MRAHVILVVAMFVAGCESGRRTTNLNEGLRLGSPDLKSLTADAKNGDAAAAWRIFVHYDAYIRDPVEAEKWLRTAAELGDSGARDLLTKRKGAKQPSSQPALSSATSSQR